MLADIRDSIEYRLEILGEDILYYGERLRKPLMLGAFISVLLTIHASRNGLSLAKHSMFNISDFSLFRRSGKSSYDSYSSFGGFYGSSSSSSQHTAPLMDSYASNVKTAKGGIFQDYGGQDTFEGQIVTLKSVEAASPVGELLMDRGNGKVLVVDGGGSTRTAIFDQTVAKRAKDQGWAGVIINGCIRNSKAISEIDIGVKAICTHPGSAKGKSSTKPAKLSFAGVSFTSGKYLYADPDGIVISKEKLDYVSDSSSGYSSYSSSYSSGSSYGGTSSYGDNSYSSSTSDFNSNPSYSTGSYNTGSTMSNSFGYNGGTSTGSSLGYSAGNSFGNTGGGYSSTGGMSTTSGGYGGGSVVGGYNSGGSDGYNSGFGGASAGGFGGGGGMSSSSYTATLGGGDAYGGGGFGGGGVVVGGGGGVVVGGGGGGIGGGGFTGGTGYRRLRRRLKTQ